MVKVKHVKKMKTSTNNSVDNNASKKKGTLKKKLKVNQKRRLKSSMRKKKNKGVVYLSHIPHGFYDEQIKQFFSQFGVVSQVSVPKSRAGNAKGYAFIEFVHPEVAQIAAETMNNYLMFNRLLKAKYIPPKDVKPRLFMKARLAKENNHTPKERAVLNVKDNIKVKNRFLETSEEAKVINKLQKKSAAKLQMMAELGVAYEIQIEQGNSSYVLKRKKKLDEKRMLERKAKTELLRQQAQAKKNEESSPSLKDNDNMSSSASRAKNQSSSKLDHRMKFAKGSKNKPLKLNKVPNKPQKKNKSSQVSLQGSTRKLQKQNQHNLKTNKSSQKKALLSKTKVKKQKDFQEKGSPSVVVSPQSTATTPKRFDSMKKSTSVGKSPKKRSSQHF